MFTGRATSEDPVVEDREAGMPRADGAYNEDSWAALPPHPPLLANGYHPPPPYRLMATDLPTDPPHSSLQTGAPSCQLGGVGNPTAIPQVSPLLGMTATPHHDLSSPLSRKNRAPPWTSASRLSATSA